jgi:hypothetical protein
MSIQYSGDKITFADGSTVASGFSGFKNRVINGDMKIDQRNAGASSAGSGYLVDRWFTGGIVGATLAFQQVADAPTGFTHSLKTTVSTASNTSDYNWVAQLIEANNVADLAWGTSGGQTVTISFWAKSSITGTVNGLVRYYGTTSYNYLPQYTINSANTWEYKTLVIPAPPTASGAFAGALNSSYMFFTPLVQTTTGYSSTVAANTWSSTATFKASGTTVSFPSNSGATFYITGVQLEKGSTATSFDYRPYGTELALCQRYFEKSYNTGTAVGSNTAEGYWSLHATSNAYNNMVFPLRWKVEKRAAPTITVYTTSGTSGQWYWVRNGSNGYGAVSTDNITTSGCRAYIDVGAAWSAAGSEGQFSINAEL